MAEGLARRRDAGAGSTTAASASRSPATARSDQALGDAALRGRHAARRACCTAPSSSPRTRGPGSCASTRRRPRRSPGVRAVVTAADVPGERWYGLLYDDWPGFVAEGEEVRCVGDVLAAVAADDARTARAAAALVEVEYEPLPPRPRPRGGARPGAPRRSTRSTRTSSSRSVIRRGDAAAALAASAHVVQRHLAHAADRAPLPRAGGRARGAAAGRAAWPSTRQGQGVFDDRRQVARFLGVPEERRPRRARAERRGLRRQGGHVGPGADGAPRARHGPAGQARRSTREESDPPAPEAPPDPTRLHGRLRRRGPAHRGRGAARRRLGRLRLGRRQGARARGRPRLRPVPGAGASTWRRSPSTPTTRPAAPCAASACHQAAFAIEGCLDLLAEEGRPRRLGDPLPQRRRTSATPFTTGQVLEKSVGHRARRSTR